MNSTTTELEVTRRRAMRTIVKGFVVGTLGLVVLFGSPGVSLAQLQPKIQRGPQCKCTCWYADSTKAGGWEFGGLTFAPPKPNDTSCKGFTSFDRYFACKDKAGIDQAGQGYAGCKYIPGIAIQPGGVLQKSP